MILQQMNGDKRSCSGDENCAVACTQLAVRLSTTGLLRSEAGFASRLGRLAEPEDEADSSNANCLCFKLIAEPLFLSGILIPDCHHFKFSLTV